MKKNSLLILLLFSLMASANVRMPLLFSDGMVLQRNKQIPVWGWADANEKVEVRFNKQTKSITADKNGKWMVKLDAEKAGGPFELTITGKNKMVITNVLVGEVWICSGQSNMEFQVSKTMNSEKEINDSNYPMIRHFGVAQDLSGTPKEDLKAGKWAVCNKENVGDFTAVGYFFAKKIHAELKIPIGIINTSWGGTNVETWTSREAFENSSEFKDMIANVPQVDIDSLSRSQIGLITAKIEKIQGSKVSTNEELLFKELNFDDGQWPEMIVPELWESQQLNNLDGMVWMRKSIIVTKEDANKKAILELAKIDDQDFDYINGVLIGTTNNYAKKRTYEIPEGLLKEGKNVIAIKIIDNTGGGGIYGDKSDLKLTLQNSVIPLSGQWKFNVVQIKSEVSPNGYPSLLYNAMINPLVPFAFHGVLWYQGEANVTRAKQYQIAFPLMINDWRSKWKQGDFPFYFVQLATFDEYGGNSKNGSKWAELREAQTETLKLPNTGMAVITDIGNAKDIHPTNKQDVGKRLAAIALNNVYGEKMVYSGPMYKSQEIKGNQIILTFDNIGSGLSTSDSNGILRGFEIAGSDKVFHSAKAIIKKNKVIVTSESVPNPVAVHYGWADDDTEINLFNKEKFPASQFRTDDWEMVTVNEKYKVSK
ncbi:sialate O-acetylesterase [Flavobacterium franklandianum]|uniref:Sialate O-acetylesterase n=1 Tax=Flavobacterium franklandianum TaxID=2594430 RepID=A0A553C6V4_9FLAO|nr:sialate O-acetylesterase [Flavobacterium franklandianum]TRX16257.1 sialate O-acetylesterase [Flavobacterium franklandianum]